MLVRALLFPSVSSVQPFSALSGARLLSRSLNQTLVTTDTYFQQRRTEEAWLSGWRCPQGFC